MRSSLWLQRAYDICADGRWHRREAVLDEMIKLIAPGPAKRRGRQVAANPEVVSQRELIKRGARHICVSTLIKSTRLTTATRGGEVFIRLQELPRKPLPIVVEPVGVRGEATHILVPIELYDDRLADDRVQLVRRSR